MFDRSARWYDAIYARLDYASEARRVVELIRERQPSATSLLDVACGTGRHLEHFAGAFRCEGLDIEPDMLDIARSRLPQDVRLNLGDMRTFDLRRRFDAVTCLFSSIGYTREVGALRAAVERMASHVGDGGVLVIEPWILPEAWREPGMATVEVVEDGDRKIARAMTSHRKDRISMLEMHYVLVGDGRIETADEHHELGLFTLDEYLDAVRDAGLHVEFDPVGLRGRGLVLGTRRLSR